MVEVFMCIAVVQSTHTFQVFHVSLINITQVTVYGDGSKEELIFTGDKLTDVAEVMRIADGMPSLKSIRHTKNSLLRKVKK